MIRKLLYAHFIKFYYSEEIEKEIWDSFRKEININPLTTSGFYDNRKYFEI